MAREVRTRSYDVPPRRQVKSRRSQPKRRSHNYDDYDDEKIYRRKKQPISRETRPRKQSSTRSRERVRYSDDFEDRYLEESSDSRPRRKPRGRESPMPRNRYPEQRPNREVRGAGYPSMNKEPTGVNDSPSPAHMIASYLTNLVFYVFTIGIILTAIMFSFSSKSTASIFGYRFYNVLTDSMVPQKDGPQDGFYSGDVVILKMMDGTQVKKGDIVTFTVGNAGKNYLTHRVVDKIDELNGEKGDYLITKGDANDTNDPPIPAEKVQGKVIFSIPKMGLVLDFIREEFWACLVCVLSLYGFFLVLRAYLFPKEPSINTNRGRINIQRGY